MLNNFKVPTMVGHVAWIMAILFNCPKIIVHEVCGSSSLEFLHHVGRSKLHAIKMALKMQ